MFEIKLSDEEHTEMKTEEDEGSEDEPLNNTLTFAQAEDLRERLQGSEVRQEVVKRGEWHRDAAETLLNALENMDVMTESSISLAQTVSEQQERIRKNWSSRLPETLLNALDQADIIDCSTETLMSSEEKHLTEEECDEDDDEDEDDDVEVDEERLEPRSDDEDTNFEESEDELREELTDSMRNLLTSQELTEEVKTSSQEVCEETPASLTAHEESENNPAL